MLTDTHPRSIPAESKNMKLYGSRTSPYVRKVRVALLELGVAFDFEVLDVWAPESGLDRLNPLAKAPVLEDEGRRMIDSLAILDYLDRRFSGALIPAAEPARSDMLRAHALAHGVIDATVARVLEGRRPPEMRMDPLMAREAARVARTLDHLEQAADSAATRALPGLGGIALGVALLYIDFRDPHDWRRTRPALAAWLENAAIRPSFSETPPS